MTIERSEVRLTVKPRPLRLVYLVNNQTELIDAVTLYTHIWGGLANAIFPVPKTLEENNSFKLALKLINPDYVFLPEAELPNRVREILQDFPARQNKLSLNRGTSTIDSKDPFFVTFFMIDSLNGMSGGEFPHNGRILNSRSPVPVSDSNIRLISKIDPPFATELILQYGNPFDLYKQYLKNHLGAKFITPPQTTEDILKQNLIMAAKYTSPIDLTKSEIDRAMGIQGEVKNGSKKNTCHLFLYAEEDLNIACYFWNSRRLDLTNSNKFILPKKEFLQELKQHLTTVIKAIPSIKIIYIYASLSPDEASIIAENIKDLFVEWQLNIVIEVVYEDFAFGFQPGNIYHGTAVTITRKISEDRSIRFSPIVPPGHENKDFVFGYDAKIEFASGKTLSLPPKQFAAVLLSNNLELVEHTEKNRNAWSEDWKDMKTQPVRPAKSGVTGVAVAGQECCIYLPEAEQVIIRWFKEAGFEFKFNNRTRYAKGFIKRFGGFEKTTNLINAGGTKIFVALSSNEAKQTGLTYHQIISFLQEKFELNPEDAGNIINDNLLHLLEAGLIYRGYSLTCPTCALENWYKLQAMKEFVECSGCATNFQLQRLDALPFTYKANELADRFLNSGGHAVLMTAVFLDNLSSSSFVQFGGDLQRIKHNNGKVFAQIDLFASVENTLILVKCKSLPTINSTEALKIVEQLENAIEAAELVNAKVIILGIATASIECNLHDLIANSSKRAKERKIALHLLLNNRFYFWAKADEERSDTSKICLDNLLIEDNKLQQSRSIRLKSDPSKMAEQTADRMFN